MTEFHIDVEIRASPEVVWAVIRDVERWPEWTPTVTSVRLLDGGPLNVGSRAVIRQPGLPPAKWRVTELDDAGMTLTAVSSAPGICVIAHHGVKYSGAGSRATLSVRFSGVLAGVLARITRDLNHRYLALEAKGLKKRTETPRV